MDFTKIYKRPSKKKFNLEKIKKVSKSKIQHKYCMPKKPIEVTVNNKFIFIMPFIIMKTTIKKI